MQCFYIWLGYFLWFICHFLFWCLHNKKYCKCWTIRQFIEPHPPKKPVQHASFYWFFLTCLVWSPLSFSPLSIFSVLHSSSLAWNYPTVFPSHTLTLLSSCVSTLLSVSLSSPSHCSQEDVKSLTAHIVENYWKALEDVDYVQTFKGLKLRYEQQRERQDNPKLDRWENLRLQNCNCCTATFFLNGCVFSD